MPCYDSRDNDGSCCEATRKDCRHNSDVAELLCRICVAAEHSGSNMLLDTAIATWWKEHQERDAKKALDAAAEKRRRIKRAQEDVRRASLVLKRLVSK